MQVGELIHFLLSSISHDRCPFCDAPKDSGSYTTYPGGANDSKILRRVMNDPASLANEQPGCRPKDGNQGRQSQDRAQPSPNPIFEDTDVGSFGNEAHHAISGNECMDGEPIEDLLTNSGGEYEDKTGYSINNCANGVYLPSYDRGRYGGGAWGRLSGDEKYEIMKVAMAGGAGQAHIGSHDGKTTTRHPQSYPAYVKGKLEEIAQRGPSMAVYCPYVDKDGGLMPTPYGVNKWLDALSAGIRNHLTSHPRTWKYFVSKYAADYHDELCNHDSVLSQVLPEGWT